MARDDPDPNQMPFGPIFGYQDAPRRSEDARSPTQESLKSTNFLDDPFRSPVSAISFLLLCLLTIASIYLLAQKYRQARSYNSQRPVPRRIPTLESARWFESGSESWEAQPTRNDSGLATEDLVKMHEIARTDEDTPTPTTTFQSSSTQTEERATFDYNNGMENACKKRGLSFDSRLYKGESMDKQQAIEEQGRLERSYRSVEVCSRGVLVGNVTESGIAQRRRTTWNMSM